MKQIFDHLRRQKIFHLKSQGTSMLPILCPNDVIYYRRTSFKQCNSNDIIMVKKNNHVFTHCVIYRTSTYLITKGNNNLESDGKIYPKQIIAKTIQVKRKGDIFSPENIYLLQSTLYFQEIVKIKKIFEREKIDFVFLKGLPLHLYYEKLHPRRLYLDCDVLIRKQCFLRAEKILLNLGYKKQDNFISKTQQLLKDKEVETSYYKIINGFPVVFDLHFEVIFMMTQLGKLEALYPQKLIDQLTDEFLKTKRTIKIQGESFSILSSPFLILYLSLHFFHHNFRGAFRLEFLDRIIRYSGECKRLQNRFWTSQNDKIKKYRFKNFTYPVFILLKKLYNAPVPISFLKSIQPSYQSLTYLSSIINDPSSVFDDEPRVKAGVNRFKNLFFLSPQPWWIKIWIFFNLQVVYSVLWTLKRRLFSFFSSRRLPLSSL